MSVANYGILRNCYYGIICKTMEHRKYISKPSINEMCGK